MALKEFGKETFVANWFEERAAPLSGVLQDNGKVRENDAVICCWIFMELCRENLQQLQVKRFDFNRRMD